MAADSTIQNVLDGDARWCIHHGDVLDALPLIPDESVDAVVCDAPYGLGEEPDPVALLRAWLDGIDAKTNSVGFMNRKWDVVPGPNYWRECFRILKPGGYLLTFAGTRTQDLMGMALRLAGFEIRDTLAYLYSQGMSKNVNLERQIAMHQCTLPGRHFASTLPKGAKSRPGDHLCPETEESVKWKGQGSALAPAHEPIIVARKPLRGTYAENTLEYGTAMNIDATRIGVSKEVPSSPRIGPFLGGFANDQGTGTGFDPNIGRWPKNVAFSHSSLTWCALCDSVTEEEERLIHDYFGIREAVRALREDNLRDAIQDQETEILLQGVRWSRSWEGKEGEKKDRVGSCDLSTLRENVRCSSRMVQGRPQEILFQGLQKRFLVGGLKEEPEAHHKALESVEESDVGETGGESSPRSISKVARGKVCEAGLRACDGVSTTASTEGTGKDDDIKAIHTGTQDCDGYGARKTAAEGRGGSPQERNQARQQTGESVGRHTGEPFEKSQRGGNGTSQTAHRSGETPQRKPRIEVETQAIPWWAARLFIPVAIDGCQRIGTTSVGANPTWDTPNRDTEPSAFTGERISKVRHGREGEASAERRYNENGSTSFAATPGPRRDAVEDVPVFRCVDGCPVALLAAQSGESNSKASTKRNGKDSEVSTWALNREMEDLRGHNDSGTAARYFQQFHTSEFDEPFRYQSKPSRREKDRGLQHFRPRSAAEVTDSEDGQERLNNARTRAGRTGGVRNPHPTTKSVELCRWLVRLVARPGQLVCVPFAGSGSECVGALLEGCRVVGVELMDTDDEPYVSVARARCEHIDGREFVPRESLRVAPDKAPRQGVLF